MTCPLWKQGTLGKNWHALVPYPERTPLLGYYDEGDPEVTDWEIKWALEHGIHFFLPCWFRAHDNLGKPVKTVLGHWLHEGLFHSRYGDKMRFAIMWENVNPIGCSVESEHDLLANVLPFWIENYFRRPNYLRDDGKPILFIYRPEALTVTLGGEEKTRHAIAKMRAACERAGLNGLIVFGENHEIYDKAGQDPTRQMADIGLDYDFSYHWPTFTKHMPAGDPPDIQQVLRAQEQCWQDREAGALPYVVTVSMGWDSRPWGSPYSHAMWHLPPPEFKTLCQHAKAYADRQPSGSLANRMILVDNWNEFGEGHYIFPTRQFGFGYLDALREVFATTPTPHKDIVPEDVGLGPYDHLFRASAGQ
jgi:hypothetical protein